MWKLYKIKSEENISGIEETKGTGILFSFLEWHTYFRQSKKGLGYLLEQ
jgi:hypothetical protein